MEFEKIRDIIAVCLGVDPEDVGEETTFEELDADSLDIFEIVTELEEEMGVEISPDDADGIKTVGDAVRLIRGGEK